MPAVRSWSRGDDAGFGGGGGQPPEANWLAGKRQPWLRGAKG